MQVQFKRWILGLGLFCLCLTTIAAQTYTVTTSSNTGVGSLRRAIHQANGRTGNSIAFVNFDPSVTVVNLTDTIDVQRLSGARIVISDDATVRIRYSGLPARGRAGLLLKTEARVYGLQFENFSNAIEVQADNCIIGNRTGTNENVFLNNGIGIFSQNDATIDGNFFGINRTSTTISGNGTGIHINTIGNSTGNGAVLRNNIFCGSESFGLLMTLRNKGFVSNNTFGLNRTGGDNGTALYLASGNMDLTENHFENNDKAITIFSSGNAIFRENTYLCNRGTSLITYANAYDRPTNVTATYNQSGSVTIVGTAPARYDSVEIYETYSTTCAGTTPCQGFFKTKVEAGVGGSWSATVTPTAGRTFFVNAMDIPQIGFTESSSSLLLPALKSSLFTDCIIPDCPTFSFTFAHVADVNCFGNTDGQARITMPRTTGSFEYRLTQIDVSPQVSTAYQSIQSLETDTIRTLRAGQYRATVRNTLTGCPYNSTNTITITQPSALLSLTNCREISPTSTPSATDGIGEVTVSGGSAPYTLIYQRVGGAVARRSVATPSVQRLTNLAAGTYNVTVTDNRYTVGNPQTNCTATCTFTITPPTCTDLSLTVQQVTNVLCNGASTGSITVQYNDLPANLPLTLRLSQGPALLRTVTITTLTGSRTHTFDSLPAGTYTISLSRGTACTVTRTATIGQPNTPLSINCQNITHAARVGEASGSASVAISGGSPFYCLNITGGVTRFYHISNTTTPTSIANLPRGTYNVVVRDTNNCTQTCSFTINDPDCTGFDVVATPSPVQCFGDNNGQIQLRPANGQAPFTYNWSLPSVGNRDFANNLAADTYRITVSDNRLCRDTVGTRVTTPSVLSAVVTPQNVRVRNGSDGSIKILVSGGTRNYDAELILNTISRPPTEHVLDTFFFKDLTKGTYTYRVWDANDCETSGTVILTDPDCNINIEATATPITCKNANNGKIRTTRTNGTAPFSYAWSITGLTADSATNLRAGTYWVAIRDSLGCMDTAFATISEPDSLYSLPQVSDVTRVNGNNGSIRVTIIGGTAPYSVRLQNGVLANLLSSNTFIFNGLTRGTYTYTVTDARGCSDTKTVTINDPICGITVRIQTDSARCNGGSDGLIRLLIGNANPPLSIRWSNGIANDLQIVENLRAGNYTFSITDNSGCTKDSTATIFEPLRLTSAFDTTKVTFVGLNNGTITVRVSGGTPSYSVKIGNDTIATPLTTTTFRFRNLAVGTYTYIVTDTNGCTTSQQVTIEGPNCNLNLTKQVVNISCNGSNNGSITFTPIGNGGGVLYTWLPAVSTTNAANNLAIGMYRVTATDGFGCPKTDSAAITQPTVLTSRANPRDVTILAPPNGNVAIGASGGTAPYRVILNTDSLLISASDSARFSNLATGTYTYTVRDFNGCTTTGTFRINPLNCTLTLTAQPTAVLCNGDSNGIITLTATGETGVPTVVWSNGNNANSLTANNLRAGNYSATVTYPNGCSATATATISTPSVLTTNFRAFGTSPNGNVAIGVSGGTAPHRVILNTDSLLIAAGDSARFSNLAAGNYTYTVRDFNGCTTTGTFTISSVGCSLSAPISLSISRDSVCSGASVTLTTPSVNQAVIYRWQTPVGVTTTSAPSLLINTVNNSYSGLYTLTLSFNGCESPPSPAVRLTVVDVSNQRVFAGLDKTECGNTTTTLTATPLINANFTGNWQSLNATVIAQPNQSSTTASGLKSGNNGFVWSVSSSVCGLVGRDTLNVYVEKMPILTETTLNLDSKSSSLLINMRELLRDSFNFRITITPPSAGFAQIQNGRFLFFDRVNLTAAQRIEIPYRLCGLQCPNLCADGKLIINVAETELDSQELEVQKLLSSNGSTSPFLEIKGLELLDKVECVIVDRWGAKVFGPVFYQNNTAGRAWDGTKDGKQLPHGAYYYSLKYTNKANKKVKKGIIYLVEER